MSLYVYMIYNKVNGKIYVGKSGHSRRWYEHLKIAKGGKDKYADKYSVVHAAINKYGPDNFVFKIIEYTETDEEALRRETQWIFLLREKGYTLYNLTDGGDGAVGFKHSEETKKLLSEINSGANHPLFGTHRSEETKNKISEGHIGVEREPFSSEWKKNMSESHKGLMIGEQHPNTNLTEKEVREIKQLLLDGVPQVEIAKKFNIKPQTVYDIKKQRSWKHVIL